MSHDRPRPAVSLWLVLACAVGCLRVFGYSAALPFFFVTDEPAHFDLVHKYARGWSPASGLEHYDRASAEYFLLYGSPEYLERREAFRGDVPPPIWTRQEALRPLLLRHLASWEQQPNHEAFSPPIYYIVAAGWYQLGELIGISGGRLLYWVRFLNVPVYGALIWLSYSLCTKVYPNRPVLAPAMLLLLALFPQDVFYSINSDVLSPLAFALAMYLLLIWQREEAPSQRLGVGVGLSAAATFLIKYSNAAILVVLAIVAAARLRRMARGDRLVRIRETLAPAVAASAPILIWLWYVGGTPGGSLGTAAKLEHLGWTAKPLGALFDHPLFGVGFVTFWSGLWKTFWRGELGWHQDVLAWPPADAFFVASSTLLLGVASYAWVADRRDRTESERLADGVALGSVAISIAVLAFLSTAFDFGSGRYPSREHPYLDSGRLVSGVLVPFSIAYLSGLSFLFRRWAPIAGPLTVLAVALLVVTGSELSITTDALRSPYNWFHLD